MIEKCMVRQSIHKRLFNNISSKNSNKFVIFSDLLTRQPWPNNPLWPTNFRNGDWIEFKDDYEKF